MCRSRGFIAMPYLLIAGAARESNTVCRFIQLPIHRVRSAKKSPVDTPHMRMPVNASSGANIRHGLANTRSPILCAVSNLQVA